MSDKDETVTFWRAIASSETYRLAYGKKRRTRTYCAGRFYYGEMSHVQHQKWRECAA